MKLSKFTIIQTIEEIQNVVDIFSPDLENLKNFCNKKLVGEIRILQDIEVINIDYKELNQINEVYIKQWENLGNNIIKNITTKSLFTNSIFKLIDNKLKIIENATNEISAQNGEIIKTINNEFIYKPAQKGNFLEECEKYEENPE